MYVFGIIVNYVQYVTTETAVDIYVDGALMGNYTHVPLSETLFLYNVLFYENQNLTNGPHNLTMITIGSPSNNISNPNSGNSLVLFDYAMYTIP